MGGRIKGVRVCTGFEELAGCRAKTILQEGTKGPRIRAYRSAELAGFCSGPSSSPAFRIRGEAKGGDFDKEADEFVG